MTSVIDDAAGFVHVLLDTSFATDEAKSTTENVLTMLESRGKRQVVVSAHELPSLDAWELEALFSLVRRASIMSTDVVICGLRPEVAAGLAHLGCGPGKARFVLDLEHAKEVLGQTAEDRW